MSPCARKRWFDAVLLNRAHGAAVERQLHRRENCVARSTSVVVEGRPILKGGRHHLADLLRSDTYGADEAGYGSAGDARSLRRRAEPVVIHRRDFANHRGAHRLTHRPDSGFGAADCEPPGHGEDHHNQGGRYGTGDCGCRDPAIRAWRQSERGWRRLRIPRRNCFRSLYSNGQEDGCEGGSDHGKYIRICWRGVGALAGYRVAIAHDADYRVLIHCLAVSALHGRVFERALLCHLLCRHAADAGVAGVRTFLLPAGSRIADGGRLVRRADYGPPGGRWFRDRGRSAPYGARLKVAVVTGASKRIGLAIADRLDGEGWTVARHSQSHGEFAANLENVGEIERLFETVHRKFGRIDAVVNNAARFTKFDPLTITEADWDYIHSVNLKAVFFCCQQAAKRMEQGGRIVNLSSLGGLRPWAEHAHYCASKAGVIMLTKALAKAWAPGITVNSVAPGAIPFESHAPEIEAIIQQVPAGRGGQGDEVARAVSFFLTAPDYITGQVLSVAGGLGL